MKTTIKWLIIFMMLALIFNPKLFMVLIGGSAVLFLMAWDSLIKHLLLLSMLIVAAIAIAARFDRNPTKL